MQALIRNEFGNQNYTCDNTSATFNVTSKQYACDPETSMNWFVSLA
jgi:hypothetical protein